MLWFFAILQGSSFEHDYTANAKEKRKDNLKNEASQLQTNIYTARILLGTVSFSLLMYYKGTYCFKCCRTAAGKALGRN